MYLCAAHLGNDAPQVATESSASKCGLKRGANAVEVWAERVAYAYVDVRCGRMVLREMFGECERMNKDLFLMCLKFNSRSRAGLVHYV